MRVHIPQKAAHILEGTVNNNTSPNGSNTPTVLLAVAGTAVVCVAGYLLIDSQSGSKNDSTTIQTQNTASATNANGPADAGSPQVTKTVIVKTTKQQPQPGDSGGPGRPTSGTKPSQQEAPVQAPVSKPKSTTVDLARLAKVTTSSSLKPAVSKSGKKIYYSGKMTIDRNPETGWVVKGDGTAASIHFTWDKPVTVYEFGMINGYAKIDKKSGEDRYFQNRRISQAGWDFGQPEIPGQRDGEDGMAPFYDDTKKPQMTRMQKPFTTKKLTIQIIGTSQYNDPRHGDTVISEIYVNGSE